MSEFLTRFGRNCHEGDELCVGVTTVPCSNNLEEISLRKIILGSLAALTLISGAFSVSASPDPEGPAQKGLCTAYFNGQKNGHDKDGDGKSNPGPFAALEAAADDGDDDTSVAEDVWLFCDGLVGGNTDHGRYTCTTDNNGTPNDSSDDTASCTNNEAPGNS
jgi:hypothetical protein